MPEPEEGETEKEFVSRCIPIVIDDGTAKDPDQAVAVCASMWEESKKSVKAVTKKEGDGDHPASHYLVVEDPQSPSSWHLRVKGPDGKPDHTLMGAAWAALHGGYRGNKYEGPEKQKAIDALTRLYHAEEMETPSEKSVEVKLGSRHNQRDRRALQDIHDAAITLGAACPSEITSEPIIPEKGLVYFGGEVKALGSGKVGGYLVRFSTGYDDTDLTGEFFTNETDFGELVKTPVYYEHGMNEQIEKHKLGKGDLRQDDLGIWIEAQLSLRDEYEKAIYELAEKGKLGWSSGTAGHLVEKQNVGKSTMIKAWPLGLDASLTPTPAEPRNSAIPMKTYMQDLQIEGESKDEPEAVGDTAASDETSETEIKSIGESHGESQSLENISEGEKMELTKEELDKMVSDAAVKGAEEVIKKLPPIEKPEIKVEVEKDEADQPWKSAGEFFQAVKNAAFHPRDEDPKLKGIKAASGASENVPADGGYLVAPQYAAGIVERIYNVGNLLSRVSVDTVSGNSMIYNALDETSRVIGSAYGGVRGYWIAEAGTKTASNPVFRQVELKLHKVAALAYATDELLADASALESWLQRTVPNVLRYMVEEAIVNGDGVGKPLGIMNSPCLVSPLRIDANEIDATDIANLWSRRWPAYNDYVWLIHTSVFPQLINMVVGNFPVLMPAMNAIGAGVSPLPSIYGRPVIETEYNQTLGTTGDIILASLSQYQMIMKGGVEFASSLAVKFTTDEMAYRWVLRTDGAPLWDSALTAAHGSATYSPFVCLATASV